MNDLSLFSTTITDVLLFLVGFFVIGYFLFSVYRLLSLFELQAGISNHTFADLESFGDFQSAYPSPSAPQHDPTTSSPCPQAPAGPDPSLLEPSQHITTALEYFEAVIQRRREMLNPPARVSTLDCPFELLRDSLSATLSSVSPPSSSNSQETTDFKKKKPTMQCVVRLQFDFFSQKPALAQLFWNVPVLRLAQLLALEVDNRLSSASDNESPDFISPDCDLDATDSERSDPNQSLLLSSPHHPSNFSSSPQSLNQLDQLPNHSDLSILCSQPQYFTLPPVSDSHNPARFCFQADASDLPPLALHRTLLRPFSASQDSKYPLVVVLSDAAVTCRLVTVCHFPSEPTPQLSIIAQYFQSMHITSNHHNNNHNNASNHHNTHNHHNNASNDVPFSCHLVSDLYGTRDKERDCIVCMTEPRDVVLLPCSHFCVGHRCLPKLTQCPLCRSGIESYLKGLGAKHAKQPPSAAIPPSPSNLNLVS